MEIRLTPATAIALILCLLGTVFQLEATVPETLTSYSSHHSEGRSIVFISSSGQRLRVTPYGDYIVRIQTVRKDEEFFSDDRYEMVESHDWDGSLRVSDRENFFTVQTRAEDGVVLRISKNPMRISFTRNGDKKDLLTESEGVRWEDNSIHTTFAYNEDEHFTGLGMDILEERNTSI
jgi:alpha-glucosidase (family GH31 glycosyl hydrolase)